MDVPAVPSELTSDAPAFRFSATFSPRAAGLGGASFSTLLGTAADAGGIAFPTLPLPFSDFETAGSPPKRSSSITTVTPREARGEAVGTESEASSAASGDSDRRYFTRIMNDQIVPGFSRSFQNLSVQVPSPRTWVHYIRMCQATRAPE